MKFTVAFAALVAVAAAAPANNVRAVDNVDTVETVDTAQLCIHIRACVEALAPSIKACALAAADKGRDLHEDADCLSEAVGAVSTVPDACKSCM
ncbi:calcium-binding protein precursor [Sporothrix schenckii 1099-18]|uniref:Fungal calcium binding protein domain-containing protein n=2 Tax=Sporothrix schenckii TaxID=29908 RepID=U7PKD8_SPOS1|nr:calcium-binding protein precursor [Sporothrix schenckii 1099-18]ERS95204.1 hypothetical protein HMPREF1624_08415 [Sporothrix schenckii ATCC 58251]KJR89996.1 calcium-binding protein precursor [Sporothrix schenckii 1099-18]